MPDYVDEPVVFKIRRPLDENGGALDASNATASIVVYEEDGTTPIIADSMTWVPDAVYVVDGETIVGQWQYRLETFGLGLSAGRRKAKLSVTPTGQTASFEWVEWELLASPPPPSTSCDAPWCEPDEVQSLADLSTELQLLVVTAASRLLWAASGRQFGGICLDTISPGADCMFSPIDWRSTSIAPVGWSRLVDYGDGWFISRASGFANAVELPGHPVVDIVAVTIDGNALPPGSWTIVDDRYLVRADGASWPMTQRLDLPPGSVGTWSIAYTWGTEPPPEGRLAARVMSEQLRLALAGDEACRLPKRLQTMTREGLSMAILDPFQFLDGGKFGLYELDVFVMAVNPDHVTRPAKVLNPDLLAMGPHRVR